MCNSCNTTDVVNKNGKCTKCNSSYRKAYRAKRKDNIKLLVTGNKICVKCKLEKEIVKFPIDYTYPNGRQHICFTCQKITNKSSKYWFLSKRVGYANSNDTANPEGKLNLADIKNKWETHNKLCNYCNTQLTPTNLAFDHITPLVRGGKNKIDNIQFICLDCNLLKFTRTNKEFLEFLKEYSQRIIHHANTSTKAVGNTQSDAEHRDEPAMQNIILQETSIPEMV